MRKLWDIVITGVMLVILSAPVVISVLLAYNLVNYWLANDVSSLNHQLSVAFACILSVILAIIVMVIFVIGPITGEPSLKYRILTSTIFYFVFLAVLLILVVGVSALAVVVAEVGILGWTAITLGTILLVSLAVRYVKGKGNPNNWGVPAK